MKITLMMILLISCIWTFTDASVTTVDSAQASPTRALDRHNELRRNPSNSSEQASDMKMMIWDSELATAAKNHAEKCEFEHGNLGNVGENLYVTRESPAELFIKATDAWYNEISDYDYDNLSCNNKKVCGHYTQIVWANSEKLGCAAALCSSLDMGGNNTWKNSIIVVCRYSPAGNYRFQKPFLKGTPCSSCPGGWSCDDKLCVNPNLPKATSASTTTASGSTTLTSASTSPTTPGTSTTTATEVEESTITTASASSPSTTIATDSGTMSTSESTTGSSTIPTSSTTSTPPNGCSAERAAILREYQETFENWKTNLERWTKDFESGSYC